MLLFVTRILHTLPADYWKICTLPYPPPHISVNTSLELYKFILKVFRGPRVYPPTPPFLFHIYNIIIEVISVVDYSSLLNYTKMRGGVSFEIGDGDRLILGLPDVIIVHLI